MRIIKETPHLLIAKASSRVFIGGVFILIATTSIAAIYAFFFHYINEVNAIILGFVFASSLLATLWIEVVTLTFDKKANTITCENARPFSRSTRSHQLSDLIEANVWDDFSPKAIWWNAATVFPPRVRLALILSTQDPPIVDVMSGWRDNDSATIEVANTINTWLSEDIDSRTLRP